ncbi:MAG: RNA polymerase subunit sigma [Lachnospiraceae bacterium]|nr:RNA polymerase subunit sigma [Lachnospiraceae bacterium]
MVDDNLAFEVVAAKTDETRLNALIGSHRNFILACASRTVRRFVTESDDEYSVALSAFYEAVQNYSQDKGHFRSFAAQVIRRRLIDFIRSESRHAGEIPVEPYSMDGEVEDDEEAAWTQMAVRSKSAQISYMSAAAGMEGSVPGSVSVRDEIEAMQGILARYGFSFYDLADVSPKAEKTKRGCAEIIAGMLSDENLMDFLHNTGTLPIKELCQISKVRRKVIERHRKYIIAAVEILYGDFPMLAEYFGYVKEVIENT